MRRGISPPIPMRAELGDADDGGGTAVLSRTGPGARTFAEHLVRRGLASEGNRAPPRRCATAARSRHSMPIAGAFFIRSPHWLFHEALLSPALRLTRRVAGGGNANGYDHFLKHGSREGRIGHLLFEPVYRAQLDQAESVAADALGASSTTCGASRRRAGTRIAVFRPDWYCAAIRRSPRRSPPAGGTARCITIWPTTRRPRSIRCRSSPKPTTRTLQGCRRGDGNERPAQRLRSFPRRGLELRRRAAIDLRTTRARCAVRATWRGAARAMLSRTT